MTHAQESPGAPASAGQSQASCLAEREGKAECDPERLLLNIMEQAQDAGLGQGLISVQVLRESLLWQERGSG